MRGETFLGVETAHANVLWHGLCVYCMGDMRNFVMFDCRHAGKVVVEYEAGLDLACWYKKLVVLKLL